jgi:hypothetical protein
MRAYRWSDNDRYFGPFTYARERGIYRPLAVVLGSGDDDEDARCRLRISGFGHTFITAMPPIVRPWRRKVAANWDKATLERLGRDWYYDTHSREYGFSYSEGFLQVFLGRQTHDSTTTQSWSKFMPWTQWRHVRHSLYGLDGSHFADMPESRRMMDTWDWRKALEDACPRMVFPFTDFDGEQIDATTRIEEREWRFGTGWWKWLSWFRRPKVSRSLDILFSKETGQRKGSWKGGTVGHSIEMLPGELHEAAFRRYCAEHDMTFAHPVTATAPQS